MKFLSHFSESGVSRHECIWKVLSLRWKLFLLEDRETGKFFPSENCSASRSFQLCYRTRRIPL